MHPQFPAILLTVVISWVLVPLWGRVLDALAVSAGLQLDRLPDALAVAVVATLSLLGALSALGQAGGALADTVAGMELTALRTPNPAVAPALLEELEAKPGPAPQPSRSRSRSRSHARARARAR